jgi:hypothetical protein
MNGNKIMKKTPIRNKMFALLLTYSMVLPPFLGTTVVYAQNDKLTYPACEDESLSAGDYCVNEKSQISKFIKRTVRTGFLGTGVGNREKIRYVSKPLSSKELSAMFGATRGPRNSNTGDWNCRTDGNCQGGTRPRGDGNDGADANSDNVRRRPSGPSTADRAGDRGAGDRGSSRASTRRSPQDEYDDLNEFCGGLPDLIEERQGQIDELNKQVIDLNLPDLQKAEQDARAKMQNSCRRDCVKLAIGQDVACKLAPDQLAEVLSKDDLGDKLLGVDTYYDGQGRFLEYINGAASVDPIKACQKVMAKKDCADSVMKNGISDCEASKDWIAAFNALEDGKKKLAQMKADLDIMTRTTTDAACKITSPSDIRRSHWKNCGTRCLEKAGDSCAKALADASDNISNSPRDGYCPTCGTGRPGGGGSTGGGATADGGTCVLGNCGVSKAAQIIGAIGNIGVPLGLGFMNMSMQNRSLNACISTYAQQVEVAKTVGLPPQASQCGLAYGMGMGGFGGGLGGQGGFGGGLGGMYPGMGGFGGQGGFGGGLGGMYPGVGGVGGGIYGGFGGQGGFGQGGFGQGGFGQGGMYPGIGGGMYGGIGGMGMNGMGGMNNGMGGMYGNALGSAQGNMMGVQQQMYTAQMQMQQMAAQNMVLQGSMGSGMGGSMYGMGMGGMGMGGMGMGGMGGAGYGYNPYASPGFGLNFSAGLNLGGSLGGGGGYNPYMMNTGYNPYMTGGQGSYYLGQ